MLDASRVYLLCGPEPRRCKSVLSPLHPPHHHTRAQEWQQRTPLVSRWINYIIVPTQIVGMLIPPIGAFMTEDQSTLLGGHVYKLVTSLFFPGGLLTLLVVMLMVMTQGPAVEAKLGSMRFLLLTLSLGMLINLVYAGIAVRGRGGDSLFSSRLSTGL